MPTTSLNPHLRAHADALTAIAAHFGLESIAFKLVAYTECRWRHSGQEVLVEDDGDVYDAEMYGTARWDADGYTLFDVIANGGEETWLVTSERHDETLDI